MRESVMFSYVPDWKSTRFYMQESPGKREMREKPVIREEPNWSKIDFYMGGAPKVPDAPAAPPPPPPPSPPPTKTDDDVEESKKAAIERKKFARGREKTLLEQVGSEGSAKKKSLLGE